MARPFFFGFELLDDAADFVARRGIGLDRRGLAELIDGLVESPQLGQRRAEVGVRAPGRPDRVEPRWRAPLPLRRSGPAFIRQAQIEVDQRIRRADCCSEAWNAAAASSNCSSFDSASPMPAIASALRGCMRKVSRKHTIASSGCPEASRERPEQIRGANRVDVERLQLGDSVAAAAAASSYR